MDGSCGPGAAGAPAARADRADERPGGVARGVDPMNLWQAANIYKVSMTLFALEEVGVLARLAAGPRLPAALATEQGLEREALEPLLELMVEAGVLARVGQEIQIDPQQAALLPL